MAIVPDASARSLTPFVKASVQEGSTVRTDGWDGYDGLNSSGYNRIVERKDSCVRDKPLKLAHLPYLSSNAGSWGPTKVPPVMNIGRTISTNSFSVSIGDFQLIVVYSFSDFSRIPCSACPSLQENGQTCPRPKIVEPQHIVVDLVKWIPPFVNFMFCTLSLPRKVMRKWL